MDGKTLADTPTHGKATVAAGRLYNSREARERLGGISESTFRRLTATGELPAVKQGAYVYVTQDAINDYIAALPSVGEPAA